MGSSRSVRARAVSLGVAALLALGGCAGSAEHAASTSRQMSLLRIAAPLEEPVWADHDGVLLGLTESGTRVEKVAPAPDADKADSSLSRVFADIGKNVAPSIPDKGVAYVPQPERGTVAVLRTSDLHQVDTLRDGPAPAYLSTDVGANALLALSANGRTVTGIDVYDHRRIASMPVDATPQAEVDGPQRERLIEYHVSGPAGIVHVKDGERLGTMQIPVAAAVSDETKVSRLYAAEQGTHRLLAVDSHRWGEGLHVVGQADLGAPVRYLGVDEYMIFAVAGDRLVVLETNSFEGYASGKIPVYKVIRFREGLPRRLRDAPVSGLAVGPHRVYLTFARQPYVESIAKPSI